MDISWTWLGIVVLALIIFACASGFRRGFVKEIVSAFFMIISFLLVWVINPYVNTFVREYTPVYNIVQSNCQELVMEQTGSQKALDKEEQTQIMEKMELPDILKTSLMENNTAETYRYLAVSTFAEYIRFAGCHDRKWNIISFILYNFCNRDQTVELYTECSDKSSCDKGRE